MTLFTLLLPRVITIDLPDSPPHMLPERVVTALINALANMHPRVGAHGTERVTKACKEGIQRFSEHAAREAALKCRPAG